MVESIITLLAVIVLFSKFIDDALLRDVHKKQLKQRFEAWWKRVEKYDKLKLALVCASKTNDFLDYAFGKKLISKRVLLRSVSISSCMLLITLSWLGIINSQPFGVTPWKNYRASIDFTLTTATELSSPTNLTIYREIDLKPLTSEFRPSTKTVVNINSNLFLLTATTNGIHEIGKIMPLGHGQIFVYYDRNFQMTNPTNSVTNDVDVAMVTTNPYEMLSDDLNTFTSEIKKYDSPSFTVLYSAIYFVALFAANAILFIVSLISCRVMLREIAATGRIFSMLALIFTNVVIVSVLSSVLLFFFTILAVPICWFILPMLFQISEDSLITVAAFLLSASFGLWLIIGTSAKLVVFIALLPTVFAVTIGAFTLMAVKWRNGFHFLIREILIRCVEKSPLGFFITVVTFISLLLVGLAHHLHFTEFI